MVKPLVDPIVIMSTLVTISQQLVSRICLRSLCCPAPKSPKGCAWPETCDRLDDVERFNVGLWPV